MRPSVRKVSSPTSVVMTLVVAVVSALSLLVGTPGPAGAADPPAASERAFEWKKLTCFIDDGGQARVIAAARSTVRHVRDHRKTYYQEIRTQVDGWQSIGSRWKQIEGRWRDHPRFTRSDLPTWSTPAIKAAVNGETVYTAKFVIKLRQVRTGPDPVVWEYTLRSGYFGCSDEL